VYTSPDGTRHVKYGNDAGEGRQTDGSQQKDIDPGFSGGQPDSSGYAREDEYEQGDRYDRPRDIRLEPLPYGVDRGGEHQRAIYDGPSTQYDHYPDSEHMARRIEEPGAHNGCERPLTDDGVRYDGIMEPQGYAQESDYTSQEDGCEAYGHGEAGFDETYDTGGEGFGGGSEDYDSYDAYGADDGDDGAGGDDGDEYCDDYDGGYY
jgi:hypothetical protein